MTKVTKSVVGYFFVPVPLGGLKSVPWDVFGHSEFIATFLMQNFWGSKNRNFFLLGGGRGDRANFDQF